MRPQSRPAWTFKITAVASSCGPAQSQNALMLSKRNAGSSSVDLSLYYPQISADLRGIELDPGLFAQLMKTVGRKQNGISRAPN